MLISTNNNKYYIKIFVFTLFMVCFSIAMNLIINCDNLKTDTTINLINDKRIISKNSLRIYKKCILHIDFLNNLNYFQHMDNSLSSNIVCILV